jgi:hypothetical protein
MQKIIQFAAASLLILSIPCYVSSMTMRADVSPSVAPDTIMAGVPFSIEIYMNNDDFVRFGHSFTLVLYSPDTSIYRVTHQDVGGQGPLHSAEYFSIFQSWDFLNQLSGFSWDGILPDSINHSAVGRMGCSPWPADLGEQVYIKFHLIINETGEFCIDSVDHPVHTYDWIFEPPSPNFNGPYCWTVIGGVDGDADGVPDDLDNCPATANPTQDDADNDGMGDDCDVCTDTDNDGFGNPGYPFNTCQVDNCPQVSNPSQGDADEDGVGDACDNCTDTDGDGYGNPNFAANTCPLDNCPAIYNAGQQDSNGDGIGDACTFSAYTEEGQDIVVDLGAYVNLTFDSVSQADSTTMTITGEGPVTPSAFEIVPENAPTYYNITTNAAFEGTILICINYDDAALSPSEESSLRLLHYDTSVWTDITTSLDTAADVICGLTSSLSPFAMGIPAYICGDVNSDGHVNILDITFLISYLYKGGPAPGQPDAANVNSDGAINILDITYLISFLYKGGPEPNCP